MAESEGSSVELEVMCKLIFFLFVVVGITCWNVFSYDLIVFFSGTNAVFFVLLRLWKLALLFIFSFDYV